MMKNLIWFFLLAPLGAFCQLSDDFSDGNFTADPVWSGDVTKYKVNSSSQLQLNDVGNASEASLSTLSSRLDNTEWNFWVNIQYNTSSSNFARIYLASDNADLKGSLNGYYVQIGGTDDRLGLYKQTGTTSTAVVQGTLFSTSLDDNICRIRVTYSAGTWNLFADPVGGTGYYLEGSKTEALLAMTPAWFGVYCKYTSGTGELYYFDEFYAGDIIPDVAPPGIKSAVVVSANGIDVSFSESIDQASAENLSNYSAIEGLGAPSGAVAEANRGVVHLTFGTAFTGSVVYNMTISGVQDKFGNAMSTLPVRFGLSETPTPDDDIVINEILFNPPGDGVDYVELYNNSQKIIDLKDMKISSYDKASGALSSIKSLSPDGYTVFPGDYVVLTTKPDKVKSQYYTPNPDGFAQQASLPSFNNTDGWVVILDPSEAVIDSFYYNESMHYPLLKSFDGVSLERVSFNRPASDKTNWHSAAETVGFGTPAYKNSQFSEATGDDGAVTLSPDIFSPDNDGYNDVLNIAYKFDEPGYTANIIIFDANGRLLRKLVQNDLLGTEGVFTWDGITEDNEKANTGIYIVYFEAFDLSGKVKKYKRSSVLATKYR